MFYKSFIKSHQFDFYILSERDALSNLTTR